MSWFKKIFERKSLREVIEHDLAETQRNLYNARATAIAAEWHVEYYLQKLQWLEAERKAHQ